MDTVDPAVVAALARHVNPASAAFLAARMLSRRRAAGEVVIAAGGPAHGLFLLVEGELDVFVGPDGGQIRVGTIHRGTFFGEAGFFDRRASSATVRAASNVQVMELDILDFEDMLEREPRHAAVLLRVLTKVLGQRVSDTNHHILDESGAVPTGSGVLGRLWGRLFGGQA